MLKGCATPSTMSAGVGVVRIFQACAKHDCRHVYDSSLYALARAKSPGVSFASI